MRRALVVLALLGASVAVHGVAEAQEPPALGECPADSIFDATVGQCLFTGCPEVDGTQLTPVVREWTTAPDEFGVWQITGVFDSEPDCTRPEAGEPEAPVEPVPVVAERVAPPVPAPAAVVASGVSPAFTG